MLHEDYLNSGSPTRYMKIPYFGGRTQPGSFKGSDSRTGNSDHATDSFHHRMIAAEPSCSG
eukprot:766595-Hanusia_phi.AAC.1